MSAQSITVVFNGNYNCGDDLMQSHTRTFCRSDFQLGESLRFDPVDNDSCFFELNDVTIGVDFHWERKEQQGFRGSLVLKADADCLWAINIVEIETYLESVISSEMRAEASLEFLKAHAVISRSWVLAQLPGHAVGGVKCETSQDKFESHDEVVRWVDHENHTLFDVCADDHCQRYQGINRIVSRTAREAVRSTVSEVLVDENGNICDARFSKCCGGRFELFENCWQPINHSYLKANSDLSFEKPHRPTQLYKPGGIFCDTENTAVLSQVLNDYDLETKDFYRWHVDYASGELESILQQKSGIDFGELRGFEVLGRGPSGRIYRLKITGSKRVIVVGKELEIRRWLSRSHLKSSAFEIRRSPVGGWSLDGRGWGHGVGLCQIGAAMMAAQGYDYRQILSHYYPGAFLSKNYGEKWNITIRKHL